VQKTFRPVFNASDVKGDGSEFDHLFKDGERFKLGNIDAEVIYVPGHTPADIAYKIGDAVFVGDSLEAMRGRGRFIARSKNCSRFHPRHAYSCVDRYAWETTVAEERANNIHVRDGVSETEFIAKREARDATLAAPELLMPSIQVNMRAGKLPPADENGVRYLKIPVRLSA
jgi:hypothetical protein